MTLTGRIRRALRRRGIDLLHARPEIADLLARRGVDTVLDVGANVGQHGALLREWGYRGRIVSFEPLAESFAALAARAARDGHWQALNIGLGDASGTATINVAENPVFSSLLGGTDTLGDFDANSRTVRTERVSIRRLDEVLPEVRGTASRLCLKVDTQGFERAILDGAGATLPEFDCIQLELSMVPMYEGEATFLEIANRLDAGGFTIALLRPFAFHPATRQLLQADAMFTRAG